MKKTFIAEDDIFCFIKKDKNSDLLPLIGQLTYCFTNIIDIMLLPTSPYDIVKCKIHKGCEYEIFNYDDFLKENGIDSSIESKHGVIYKSFYVQPIEIISDYKGLINKENVIDYLYHFFKQNDLKNANIEESLFIANKFNQEQLDKLSGASLGSLYWYNKDKSIMINLFPFRHMTLNYGDKKIFTINNDNIEQIMGILNEMLEI